MGLLSKFKNILVRDMCKLGFEYYKEDGYSAVQYKVIDYHESFLLVFEAHRWAELAPFVDGTNELDHKLRKTVRITQSTFKKLKTGDIVRINHEKKTDKVKLRIIKSKTTISSAKVIGKMNVQEKLILKLSYKNVEYQLAVNEIIFNDTKVHDWIRILDKGSSIVIFDQYADD